MVSSLSLLWLAVAAGDPGVVTAPGRGDAPWGVGPVVRPRFRLGKARWQGQRVPQLALGGDLGVRYGRRVEPRLIGHTRASYVHTWGLDSGSAGNDVALGSFFGIEWDHLAFTAGPDGRWSAYGEAGADDFYLPASWGLAWVTDAEFRLNPMLALLTEVTPQWLTNPDRHRSGIGPWDELTITGALRLRLWRVQLVIGYEHFWCVAGDSDRFILSLGLAPPPSS